ncbi:MAG: hypothetical protein R2731_10260 [Nocardioides sp.]
MGRFAREDIRAVLASFGIASARRAVGTGEDEEILLIAKDDYERTDNVAVTAAVMDALPHVKVWVIPESPAWETEPL